MTADELLMTCQEAGIVLEARGDRLHVEAPSGAVTPELRAELARRKADLLVLLVPVTEFVTLKGGLVLPVPAIRLALDLEHRGFTMSLDERQEFQIAPAAALTEADLTAIGRWRRHLAAIVGYDADAYGAAQ